MATRNREKDDEAEKSLASEDEDPVDQSVHWPSFETVNVAIPVWSKYRLATLLFCYHPTWLLSLTEFEVSAVLPRCLLGFSDYQRDFVHADQAWRHVGKPRFDLAA